MMGLSNFCSLLKERDLAVCTSNPSHSFLLVCVHSFISIMRFSTSLLAAGLSALALSFPVDRDRDVECDWHPVMPPTYKIPEPPTNPHEATYSSSIVSSYTVSIPASPPTIVPSATLSAS